MGSIYKALTRASKERQVQGRATDWRPIEPTDSLHAPGDTDEDMYKLLECIESLPIRKRGKVAQFVGSKDWRRAATIASTFAETIARGIGLSVLLVGEGDNEADLHSLTCGKPSNYPMDKRPGAAEPERALHQVGATSLFVCSETNHQTFRDKPDKRGSSSLRRPCLIDRFDLVVLFSKGFGPLSPIPHISPWADVVALVLEPEDPLSPAHDKATENGLVSALDQIAKGLLLPRQTLICLETRILLLTHPEDDSSEDRPDD